MPKKDKRTNHMGTIDFGEKNTTPSKAQDKMHGKISYPTPGRRPLQKDTVDFSEER